MDITIPGDTEAFARDQAAAAGFSNVSDYIVCLLNADAGKKPRRSTEEALADLAALRAEVPKMTPDEVVALVAEARADSR